MARTPVDFSKKQFFDSFRRKYPDIDITPEQHSEIINAGGAVMAELLLQDGEFKMANRIGVLNIRKFICRDKGENFAVFADKYESRKQGQKVLQFNDHTDGFMYHFVWDKKMCKAIIDKNMWVFKPIRSLKRALAYLLKNKLNDYPASSM